MKPYMNKYAGGVAVALLALATLPLTSCSSDLEPAGAEQTTPDHNGVFKLSVKLPSASGVSYTRAIGTDAEFGIKDGTLKLIPFKEVTVTTDGGSTTVYKTYTSWWKDANFTSTATTPGEKVFDLQSDEQTVTENRLEFNLGDKFRFVAVANCNITLPDNATEITYDDFMKLKSERTLSEDSKPTTLGQDGTDTYLTMSGVATIADKGDSFGTEEFVVGRDYEGALDLRRIVARFDIQADANLATDITIKSISARVTNPDGLLFPEKQDDYFDLSGGTQSPSGKPASTSRKIGIGDLGGGTIIQVSYSSENGADKSALEGLVSNKTPIAPAFYLYPISNNMGSGVEPALPLGVPAANGKKRLRNGNSNVSIMTIVYEDAEKQEHTLNVLPQAMVDGTLKGVNINPNYRYIVKLTTDAVSGQVGALLYCEQWNVTDVAFTETQSQLEANQKLDAYRFSTTINVLTDPKSTVEPTVPTSLSDYHWATLQEVTDAFGFFEPDATKQSALEKYLKDGTDTSETPQTIKFFTSGEYPSDNFDWTSSTSDKEYYGCASDHGKNEEVIADHRKGYRITKDRTKSYIYSCDFAQHLIRVKGIDNSNPMFDRFNHDKTKFFSSEDNIKSYFNEFYLADSQLYMSQSLEFNFYDEVTGLMIVRVKDGDNLKYYDMQSGKVSDNLDDYDPDYITVFDMFCKNN